MFWFLFDILFDWYFIRLDTLMQLFPIIYLFSYFNDPIAKFILPANVCGHIITIKSTIIKLWLWVIWIISQNNFNIYVQSTQNTE